MNVFTPRFFGGTFLVAIGLFSLVTGLFSLLPPTSQIIAGPALVLAGAILMRFGFKVAKDMPSLGSKTSIDTLKKLKK